MRPAMATVGLFQIPGVPLPRFPSLSAGRIVAQQAGWQTVLYRDAFTGVPVVYARPPALLVVAESREGWFTPRQFTAPKIAIQLPMIQLPPAVTISVPGVTVPTIAEIPPFSLPSVSVAAFTISSVALPSIAITVPTLAIPRVGASVEDFRTRLAQIFPFNATWGVGFVNIDWIRDGLRDAIATILNILWQVFVQPQIDRVQSSAQGALNTFRDNIQGAVNTGLSRARDAVQNALNATISDANTKIAAFRSSINTGLKTITDGANTNLGALRVRVNDAIRQIPGSVQTALNTFGSGLETGVNSAFAANRDTMQAGLEQIRVSLQDSVNGGFLQVTGFATQALNEIVPMLWRTLGLPERQLIVPILYKARLDGFDFHAPVAGVVVHFSAWGT